MKLLHLADLHIGKIVNRFSMLEDQKYILEQVLRIVDEEQPEAVVIAGDIYDRTSPPADAVAVFDDFLVELTRRGQKVFMIYGNHDSAERIAYASRILKNSNVFVSKVYDGNVEPVVLKDEFGEVNFYLLPFVKPAHVRHSFEDEKINDHSDAVRVAVEHMDIDRKKRNVLVAHQFITNAELSGSEERSIGGTENVDVSAVEDFDYVALGHIHKAQGAGKKHVRYSGSLLKYSFDEAEQTKSVTIVELKEKGTVDYRNIDLTPLREMRVIEGSYETVMQQGHADSRKEDYVKVILTDENDIPDAIRRLRTVYPNIMQLQYNNTRTNSISQIQRNERVEVMKPIEIISDLFKEQNGREMEPEQVECSERIIKDIWG
ncbi:MAG: exonuclease SbcCD subunit D [Lachnospiraceae bacterium]|nr:exonuclease SbcCD subunit D [Lachnospiraceae bacterium]